MKKEIVSSERDREQRDSQVYDIEAIPDTFDNILRAVVSVPVEKVEAVERDSAIRRLTQIAAGWVNLLSCLVCFQRCRRGLNPQPSG